jgi:hypothetical protein
MKSVVSQFVVQIDGRHAIPVRAIPYVTGWKLSPDELAQQLGRRASPGFARLKSVAAYHVQAGFPVKMLPKEWDACIAQLAGFAADVGDKFPNDTNGSQRYAAWRDGSAELLPAGAFVWRDEFEADFYRDFSPEAVTFSFERPGDVELIYSPLVSEYMRAAMLAGFDNPPVARAAVHESALSPGNLVPEPSPQKHIPGDLPRNSMGQLAVKAAWIIESEARRRATAKEVMERLQGWADQGTEPAVLKESNRANRSVVWLTNKGIEKRYGMEACEKTLGAWLKSRL